MKKLKIDLDELIDAMSQHDRDLNEWYLDKTTGKVLLIDNELLRRLEGGFADDEGDSDEAFPDEDDEDGDGPTSDREPETADSLEKLDMPEWQREAMAEARAVCEDTEDRYVHIEPIDSSKSFRWMERFLEQIEDSRTANLVAASLGGPGSFRRFKDALHAAGGGLLQQWHSFEQEHLREAAREWLESLEIELEED